MKVAKWLMLLASMNLFYCQQQSKHDVVVARVGKSELLLSELKKRFPPEYSKLIKRKHYIDYVKRWIEKELIYQEAMRLGIDREPEVVSQIEKTKRDILYANILNRYAKKAEKVKEEKLLEYYTTHKNEYVRVEPEVKILHILAPDLATAWKVRNQINKENFTELAKKFSVDPVESIESLTFLSREELLPELAHKVFSFRIGGITGPIKTRYGYYIIQVIDKKKSDTLREYEDVSEEIRNKLMSTEMEKKREGLLEALKSKTLIQTDFSFLPGKQEAPALSEPASALDKIAQEVKG